jgi:hypothetical protein
LEQAAECEMPSPIAELCALEITPCEIFVPNFAVVQRKQFGRAAALASRASFTKPN